MTKSNFEKLPAIAKLFIAPCLGALFVIFLPVLGFYMLGKVLITKLFRLNAPYAQNSGTSTIHENQ